MLELHVELSSRHIDELSEALFDVEAATITLLDRLGQPIYEPAPAEIRLWEEVTLIALFENDEALNSATKAIQPFIEKKQIFNVCVKAVPEINWVKETLKQFKAARFGKKLWVCPSFEKAPETAGTIVYIDPGLAFGTGTHATTRLCLEWLDGQLLQGKTVIDYGCGSGILALAALKLGAAHATAIDYDPQALEATLSNAAINDFTQDKLKVLLPEQFAPVNVDILIANILANPIIENAAYFSSLIKPAGAIVLSGILEAQVPSVLQAYEPYFHLDEPSYHEGWSLITGNRR